MQQLLTSAITPILIFVYLLFALFLISQFERKTRREMRKVKEHLIGIERELGKLLALQQPLATSSEIEEDSAEPAGEDPPAHVQTV